MRDRIFAYIKKKYKANPEYPWGEDDGAVLRHEDNRKWFALVMNIGRDKLGLTGEERVDVVNLKIDDMAFKDVLMQDKGIFPAYHMNKEHWITVLLDGTVEEGQIRNLKPYAVVTAPAVLIHSKAVRQLRRRYPPSLLTLVYFFLGLRIVHKDRRFQLLRKFCNTLHQLLRRRILRMKSYNKA